MQGYRIAYCKNAYALEEASADMTEEGKRKVRIAAGGLQSIGRLAPLLNPLRYGILWWQYLSHRILRWSVTPILLFALVPLNIALVAGGRTGFSTVRSCCCKRFFTAAHCKVTASHNAKSRISCCSSPTISSL